jgi:hypothetical protein
MKTRKLHPSRLKRECEKVAGGCGVFCDYGLMIPTRFHGLHNLFPERLSQSEHKRRVAVPSQPSGMRLGGMVHTASGALR